MAAEHLLGGPRVRRKLSELASRNLNFDASDPAALTPANGWHIDAVRQALPPESPGAPVKGGSWDIARRLMSGYEFADPSIVRAYYDPAVPLAERDMLLQLRALRLVRVYVGVRVGEVYEETRELAAGNARVWGWNYRTLEGHVERGQMDWQVWKWLDTGEVEFRIHAASRAAPIRNPFVWVGFRLLRGRERRAFIEGTKRRMRTFTELALEREPVAAVRDAAAEVTARPVSDGDEAHDAVARNLGDDGQANTA